MKKNILFLLGGLMLSGALCCNARNTNPVFNPDVIKTTMNKAAEWQIKNPRHAQNDWTNGAFYAGMFAAW